jgi:hypothetical protein
MARLAIGEVATVRAADVSAQTPAKGSAPERR